MKRLAILLALFACGCSKPNEPTVQACEKNNTGTIRFSNLAKQGTAYDIVWDGVRIWEKVAAGATTEPREEAAGVAHTLSFRVSVGFNGSGCSTSTPILIKCQTRTLTCDQ